eukprot:NODE_972_length_2821_cov_1.084864.p1 type:complete len:270 gc:universal NODE_972_length_2821_cov_1.084864:899-1708(+)
MKSRANSNFQYCAWCASYIQYQHFLNHCHLCTKIPSILKLDAFLTLLSKRGECLSNNTYRHLHLKREEFYPYMNLLLIYFEDSKTYVTCKYCSDNIGAGGIIEHFFTCKCTSSHIKSNFLLKVLKATNRESQRIDLRCYNNVHILPAPSGGFANHWIHPSKEIKSDVAVQLKQIRDVKEGDLTINPLRRVDSVFSVSEKPVEENTAVTSKANHQDKLELYKEIMLKELEITKLDYVYKIIENIYKTDISEQKVLLEAARNLSTNKTSDI